MKRSEIDKFLYWYRVSADYAKTLIAECEKERATWGQGFNSGWAQGFMAGLRRMLYSVDLPIESKNNCKQILEGLHAICSQKTGLY